MKLSTHKFVSIISIVDFLKEQYNGCQCQAKQRTIMHKAINIILLTNLVVRGILCIK